MRQQTYFIHGADQPQVLIRTRQGFQSKHVGIFILQELSLFDSEKTSKRPFIKRFNGLETFYLGLTRAEKYKKELLDIIIFEAGVVSSKGC